MSNLLRVGQKVTLVRDYTPALIASSIVDGVVLPVKGLVYTVRGLSTILGLPCCWLEEIRNDISFYLDIGDFAEPSFNPDRFRPLVERKSDISIFKAMLNPSKQGIPA